MADNTISSCRAIHRNDIPGEVHRVRISAVVDELTNTVHESTKKRIEAENAGLEVTEVRWLSKPDERKRYGSMLLRLADEEAANALLSKGLLDIAGESCIVQEWEIQKAADRRTFKCQEFGHLATSCLGPDLRGIVQNRDIRTGNVSTLEFCAQIVRASTTPMIETAQLSLGII